jgi:hypothetical protein
MYCSTCGVAVTQNLSYCNQCGAKLNRGESLVKSSEVKPDMLIRAIVTTFIFGIGMTAVLIGVMKSVLALPAGTILGFMLVPLVLMLILEAVFIRLLLRGKQASDETTPALPKSQITNELDASHAKLISEPAASVTEHTTRAFDPIYHERK